MTDLELIKKKPYQYIQGYYEQMYPFIGGRVFSIASLIPVSLIIPKIERLKKVKPQTKLLF